MSCKTNVFIALQKIHKGQIWTTTFPMPVWFSDFRLIQQTIWLMIKLTTIYLTNWGQYIKGGQRTSTTFTYDNLLISYNTPVLPFNPSLVSFSLKWISFRCFTYCNQKYHQTFWPKNHICQLLESLSGKQKQIACSKKNNFSFLSINNWLKCYGQCNKNNYH